MIYRRLDENGDYTFGQGKYNFVSDTDAVVQNIKTRILLYYKEWWENLEDGTPLFETILTQRMSDAGKQTVDLIIKDRILTTDNVLQLTEFDSYFNRLSNTYNFTATVETSFGTLANLTLELGV